MPRTEIDRAGCAPERPAADNWRGPATDARRVSLLFVLPFLIFFLVQLFHHQLWQDEINAWGIAVASPTLRQLFTYLHFEAHPSIWYLLLWPVARFTANPLGMKAVQAGIGVAIYLWIALKSPFSRWEKLLLYCSYFVSFEYTVLSRMYGVLLLLALIYAYRRATRPGSILAFALLLGLMINTDIMGLLLSFALIAEYLVYLASHPEQARAIPKPRIWAAAIGLPRFTRIMRRDDSDGPAHHP